jgi:hypothetical protein
VECSQRYAFKITGGHQMKQNVDTGTVKSFGDKWSRFDQSERSAAEAGWIFNDDFAVFPWGELSPGATGFDLGYASGRWAPRVGHLHCVAPSSALDIAKTTLSMSTNVSLHRASVETIRFSRTVRVSDTRWGFCITYRILRPPFAPVWPSSSLARCSCCISTTRLTIARLSLRRYGVVRTCPGASSASCRQRREIGSDVLAVLVYYRLARFALLDERMGLRSRSSITETIGSIRYEPIHAIGSFGPPLEHRFTRKEIGWMMEAGLGEVRFSAKAPYWCAVGVKR